MNCCKPPKLFGFVHINVSAITYDLIKDQFPCTYRGKIDAKGKGELDMYFVN